MPEAITLAETATTRMLTRAESRTVLAMVTTAKITTLAAIAIMAMMMPDQIMAGINPTGHATVFRIAEAAPIQMATETATTTAMMVTETAIAGTETVAVAETMMAMTAMMMTPAMATTATVTETETVAEMMMAMMAKMMTPATALSAMGMATATASAKSAMVPGTTMPMVPEPIRAAVPISSARS